MPDNLTLITELHPQVSFNIIVFSKDRAMQLDLFIRSFNYFVENAAGYIINVLYTYSNRRFSDGYNKLINKGYSNVRFKREMSFKADLISLILPDMNYTVFFVDDNVFKNPMVFYDSQMDVFNANDSIICRSLRLHKNLTYCYPARVSMTPPVFEDNNMFKWYGQAGDYGYPFSVDGHIFRTNVISSFAKDMNYSNPNTFEGAMQKQYTNCEYMICYDKSIIVNNPVNRVQAVNDNIHGKISAEWLNEQFLKGKCIKLEPFAGIENSSCHQELPIELEDEGNRN